MKEVSLFIPCTVDLFLPRIGEAAVSLLRRAGVNPVYHEDQTCCGQPAMNAGYQDEARKVAKHFISVFEKDEVVVSPSGLLCLHGEVPLPGTPGGGTKMAQAGRAAVFANL